MRVMSQEAVMLGLDPSISCRRRADNTGNPLPWGEGKVRGGPFDDLAVHRPEQQ